MLKEKFTRPSVIILFVLLSSSLGVNIYLGLLSKSQQATIQGFIPAAVSLQDENNRLQRVGETQKDKINELLDFKDSILQEQQHPQPYRGSQSPGMSNLSAPPANQVQPLTYEPNFKDLNKNIPR